MLEDRQGAIAYGYVAQRVFYARFVGRLSAELGTSYVRQLEATIGALPSLAYFADASALDEYDFRRAHTLCALRFDSTHAVYVAGDLDLGERRRTRGAELR